MQWIWNGMSKSERHSRDAGRHGTTRKWTDEEMQSIGEKWKGKGWHATGKGNRKEMERLSNCFLAKRVFFAPGLALGTCSQECLEMKENEGNEKNKKGSRQKWGGNERRGKELPDIRRMNWKWQANGKEEERKWLELRNWKETERTRTNIEKYNT